MINEENEEFEEFKPLPLSFVGKTAAVVGIGISNRPLIDFLLAEGASVTACDRKTREKLGTFADELEAKGVKLRLGEQYLDGITEQYVFRAPGIRFDKPEFLAASESGSVITSEMELFFERCPARIIGITGSSGKTTTTTLISLLLEAAGKRVFLGGNIGRSLLPDLDRMTENDFAVVELSSFQLHTMRRSPDVSVITNISPNHLDYHKGMEEYIDAKCNILRYMPRGGKAVLNLCDPIVSGLRAVAADGVGIFGFDSSTAPASDAAATVRDGYICCGEEKYLALSDIRIPGHFNVENYMAALSAVCAFVTPEQASAVARSFGGVPHRIQLIPTENGVRYYNSSIDSSPSRTEATLGVFKTGSDPEKEGRLIVICGGYDKKIPYEPLAPVLCRKADAVILTGATGPVIGKVLDDYFSSGKCPEDCRPEIHPVPLFDDAVKAAHTLAKKGDTVLLSPASASFDAFENFEKRGERFAELVRSFSAEDAKK